MPPGRDIRHALREYSRSYLRRRPVGRGSVTKVLLVDDEVAIVDLFGEALREEGYEVIVALDGVAALELYVLHRPAIVITDLALPRMSGLDVIRRLRGEAGCRIIAISGSGSSYLDRAIECGAAMAFAKPVDIRELIDGVRQLVGGLER